MYIIGGVPIRLGTHAQRYDSPVSKQKPQRKRDINMSWILQKTGMHYDSPTIRYEVGYMEEVETNYRNVFKFQFSPVYVFKTLEEAERKVHYLNGGNNT